MKIDIKELKRFHDAGQLRQGTFGDAQETACLMSALTGGTDFNQCEGAGWPLWLAELGALLFDNSPDPVAAWEFATEFSIAVRDADARNVDWHGVFLAIRLDSILPVAYDAIGDGDEPWRVACRNAVRACIAGNGLEGAAEAAEAAEAAWAAWAEGAAGAAWAAWAAWAAEAAWAAGAAEAAWAAWAAGAAGAAGAAEAAGAYDRITESTVRCIRAAGRGVYRKI